MTATVIDYDAGNLRSVETALIHLGARFTVTHDADTVATADQIILPGVGDAAAAMETLRNRGMDQAIHHAVQRGVPLLGICLGSQIILERSEENNALCLGIIPGEARLFRTERKVPHMGWNTITVEHTHPLFARMDPRSSFYFVHSYFPVPRESRHSLALCRYDEQFAAVVGNDTVVATQFHPEKSGEPGLRMLQAFLAWKP